MLSKYGYNVLTASGGEEALNIYSKNKALIKLVITDIMLPGMDGKALSLMIKEKSPDVKIIYMSGQTILSPIMGSWKRALILFKSHFHRKIWH